MEQSKLISLVIAKLKVAYPHYFEKLTDEEFLGFVSLYQENLLNCNANALILAIKNIIRKSKYMPSLAEIIEEYKKYEKEYFLELIKSSNIDFKDKNYLLSMVEWYSLHEEYPKDILQKIHNIENNSLLENKKEALIYDNQRTI